MNTIFLKYLLLLPLLFFIEFVLMVFIGCTSCILGFNSTFYECTYCTIGKVIAVLFGLVVLYTLFSDIKKQFQKRLKN